MKKIFLPGGDQQLELLSANVDLKGKQILVAGAASEEIAMTLANKSGRIVNLIMEDLDSFMNAGIQIDDDKNVKTAIMDFEVTDFAPNTFDIIYAQASISLDNRNKIIKEFKRLLKPEGILCVGEVIVFREEPPSFVIDIFESSGMAPLLADEIEKYYTERKFKILLSEDLTSSLNSFYSSSLTALNKAILYLTDREKSYYKKLVKKIKHESEAYLKLGADKYIGFKTLILQKES
jgi:ubiquinone/menaquinone biosynthesis C-methylase UbiE